MARFYLDPAKFRIGIKRLPDGLWRATVSRRGHSPRGLTFSATHRVPIRAVVLALKKSVFKIDRDLEWGYAHPQTGEY